MNLTSLHVREAFAELSPPAQAAVRMRLEGRMRPSDIGRALGVSTAEARELLAYAMAVLLRAGS